jgi:hypothetical protein
LFIFIRSFLINFADRVKLPNIKLGTLIIFVNQGCRDNEEKDGIGEPGYDGWWDKWGTIEYGMYFSEKNIVF